MGNNTLHDWTISKLTDDRFLGTGSFLIRYYNGRTK